MAEGLEPTWSMGDDAPLAVLSERPRPLHAYFRQRFAQVTNPAIDSLRERKIMALDSFIGRRGNLLEESAEQAQASQISSIAIDDATMDAIKRLTADGVAPTTISTLFEVSESDASSVPAQHLRLRSSASPRRGSRRRSGVGILVLSDRGIDEGHAPIPRCSPPAPCITPSSARIAQPGRHRRRERRGL